MAESHRTAPVVRWLQLAVIAVGIGVALTAAPGVALADDAAASTSTHDSVSHKAKRANSAATNQSSSSTAKPKAKLKAKAVSERPVAKIDATENAAAPTALATAKVAPGLRDTHRAAAPEVRTLPSAVGPTPTATAAAAAVDQFLTSAANWLSTLAPNPITDLLSGGLYLVRRSLFPASVGVITEPIEVPLYFTDTNTNSGEPKLGIYVSLGYGGTPQLFEFDTGAGGFYAAYASSMPGNSPWWGTSVTTTSQSVHDSFDSGLVYEGYAATGTVSLYNSANSTTPLVSTGSVTVGQIDSITQENANPPQTLWTSDGSVGGLPPIEGAFYGDFGMAPTYQTSGISNLINQLTFAGCVTPGYRIHVDETTGQAWLQIGLTAQDLQDPAAMFFAMIHDSKAPAGTVNPNSGVDYYALQLFAANITITKADGTTVIADTNVGITPDTGASTTLHNTQNSGTPSEEKYKEALIDWQGDDEFLTGRLKSDHNFLLSGTTTDNQDVSFFGFKTTGKTDAGRVGVQNKSAEPNTPPLPQDEMYYLNTGISLFFDYDVVYNMGTSSGGGAFGLIPRS